MSSHKKALTDEELLAQFESLDTEDASTLSAPSRPSASAAAPADDDDPFADLTTQLAAPRASRPSTPRLSSSTTSGTNRSPKRAGGPETHTPASSSGPPSGRTSEDRLRSTINPPRKSGESMRSFHQSFTPNADAERPTEQTRAERREETSVPVAPAANGGGGGGWWGSVFNVASAAVKQAEAAVKEIQKNEEAMRWAEQVKGNVKGLRGIGTDLTSRALPTFTNFLSHIAPPISAHERLQIHTTHDLVSYPSLDPLIYSTFARVMSQVEGGDLLVIQRGSESTARRRRSSSELGYRGGL
ncbi:hypothetical protein LTR66_001223, partial [Elasticomyces elasticus]